VSWLVFAETASVLKQKVLVVYVLVALLVLGNLPAVLLVVPPAGEPQEWDKAEQDGLVEGWEEGGK